MIYEENLHNVHLYTCAETNVLPGSCLFALTPEATNNPFHL